MTQTSQHPDFPRVERITGLYFPEMREAIASFTQLHQQAIVELLRGSGESAAG